MSKPFIIAGEKGLKALPYWLRDLGVNTYSYSRRTKINVGYDSKPDSDWGKYEWRGSIIIRDPDLFDKTETVIAKAIQ